MKKLIGWITIIKTGGQWNICRACWVAGLVIAASLARAEGRWLQPADGWEHVYAASNGLPEVADENWIASGGYQSGNSNNVNYVAIVNDVNEGDVLMLTHTNGTSVGNRWPNYAMTDSPGSGTTNDLITMDMRFRLADNSQPDATSQLMLMVSRPRLDGVATGRHYWLLQFVKGGIMPGNNIVSGTPLGTEWHTIRMIINVAVNSAKVYLDNMAAPVISGWGGIQSIDATYNRITFGDGMSTLMGIAEIKSLQWTRSELVEPIIEWVHNGDTEPLSEGWSYSHNAKDLFYAASNNVPPETSSQAWSRNNFESGSTSIVTDEITGEKTLQLVMTSEVEPYKFARYLKSDAEGMFTTNQITTCRMRFRLVDETQPDDQAQLMCGLKGPRPDGVSGSQMFYVTFSKDRIRYYNNTTLSSYMVGLSTNWHELVWTQNWRTRAASFYLDGSSTAAFEHSSLQDTLAQNYTAFGDGSSSVNGIARVSTFDLTRQGVEWSGGTEEETAYWEGVDSGTSLGEYFSVIPADMIGAANGWTASARVHAVAASTPLNAISMLVNDGTHRWSMMFTPTGSYYGNGDAAAVSLGGYVHRADYHTVQMYYDPAGDGGNGVVRYYDDGWLKGTVARADTYEEAQSSPSIRWGSVNTAAISTQRWSWVEFSSGNMVINPIYPDGTMILIQ